MCLCICVSVTKLAATYLICESKVQLCKVLYGVPNACIVWISLKTLYFPVLMSFADAKLLNFFPASGSISLRINRTLCVARYIQYVRITNSWRVRFRHGCKNTCQRRHLPSSAHWRAFNGLSWLLFNSKGPCHVHSCGTL